MIGATRYRSYYWVIILSSQLPVDTIRIALTKRCNLHCFYCHREGETLDPPTRELTAGELDNLLSVASDIGITKVRFTGGEPLLRTDIVDIVSSAAGYMKDVSISTNGVMLAGLAKRLRQAGLDRINVTLNTLDPKTYQWMTGSDVHSQVLAGIEAAYEQDLTPLKLNMVLVKRNEAELDSLIDFVREGMMLQIIELIASREGEHETFYEDNHVDMDKIEGYLASRAERISTRTKHRRSIYYLPQQVEIVRSMHNPEFCKNCSSIRVTSDGAMKLCLFNNDVIPVEDYSDKDVIRSTMEYAIRKKHPYW